MQKLKKITRKLESLKLEGMKCDWCGKEFKNMHEFENGADVHNNNTFEFIIGIGAAYPDGDCRQYFKTELCFKCQLKLLLELDKLGVKFFNNNWRAGQDYYTSSQLKESIESKRKQLKYYESKYGKRDK